MSHCACQHYHGAKHFEAWWDGRFDPPGGDADKHWDAWKRAVKRAHPRQNEPWTIAEDRRLIRLVGGDLEIKLRDPALHKAAKTLGRSPCALHQRLRALQLVRRHIEAARPQKRRDRAGSARKSVR